MKTILLSICLVLILVASSFAQPYSIDCFSVAGGGGTSTGGVYSISGTVGQPDAGATMTGGAYTVDGGFWSLVGVTPTPGAPRLSITRSGSEVIRTWPSPSAGFVLQESSALLSTNWIDVTSVPTVVGNEKQVSVTPSVGSKFYRLKFQ